MSDIYFRLGYALAPYILLLVGLVFWYLWHYRKKKILREKQIKKTGGEVK